MKFCPHCGLSLAPSHLCPHCGASMQPHWIYCVECGKGWEAEKKEDLPSQTPSPIPPKPPKPKKAEPKPTKPTPKPSAVNGAGKPHPSTLLLTSKHDDIIRAYSRAKNIPMGRAVERLIQEAMQSKRSMTPFVDDVHPTTCSIVYFLGEKEHAWLKEQATAQKTRMAYLIRGLIEQENC